MIGIRGAITVDSNTEADILRKTTELFREIIEKNDLIEDDVISITFSVTRDLTKVYPARAVREMGWSLTPLFCVQEMYVEGALEKVIRVLVLVEKKGLYKAGTRHVYLGGARGLRPDLLD